MVALTVGLAVLVGVSLGLLGGGGSILTVPLLAYVAGVEPKQAIATSLLVVGVTSAVGAVAHARAGHIQWRTGVTFGSGAMAGAYAGGALARFIPGTALLVGFAVMMIGTAVAMLRGRRLGPAAESGHPRSAVKVIGEGLVVGLVTGLVGAGGGFLVVPALALLGGLPMPVAIGTSLLVIAMKSFAGLGGYLTAVDIDWTLAAMVTTAAVAGGLVGARLTSRISPEALREAFGWFVLVMASAILAQEVHPILGLAAAAATVIAAALFYAGRRRPHTVHLPVRATPSLP